MQEASILAKNPNAQIFTISSQAHQGLTELLRELKTRVEAPSFSGAQSPAEEEKPISSEVPTISLNPSETKNTWNIERTEDGVFIVRGEKIEKFARRTDLSNYASVNRLRDIMKKLGIKSELTSLGAEPESIISIAGKEFTLVEDY